MRKILQPYELSAFLYCISFIRKMKTGNMTQKEFLTTISEHQDGKGNHIGVVARMLAIEKAMRYNEELSKKSPFEERSLNMIASYATKKKITTFSEYIKTYGDEIKLYGLEMNWTKEYMDSLYSKHFSISKNKKESTIEKIDVDTITYEQDIDRFKIALMDVTHSVDGKNISVNEEAMQQLQTTLRDVFLERNKTVPIRRLNAKESLDMDKVHQYDLIIDGKSIEESGVINSRIRFRLHNQGDPIKKDYQQRIAKRYRLMPTLFPEEGALPDNIQFITNWVLVIHLYFNNEFDECLEVLKDLDGMLSKYDAESKKEIDVGIVEINFVRGVIYMLLETPNYAKALNILSNIETNYRDDLKKKPNLAAKLYHNIGVLRRRSEKSMSSAFEYFEKAVALRPEQWQSHWELGMLSICLDKSYKKHYDEAITYNPSSKLLKEEYQRLSTYDGLEDQKIREMIESQKIDKITVIKGK